MELGWELPFPSSLWEAKDPQVWLQRFEEHFGPLEFTRDTAFALRGMATTSLTIATQNVMTKTPCSELLRTLAASPLAVFFLLMNLSALVRDFTRSYYQLPPSLSDPNAFHILTQSQTKQIHTAVEVLAAIVRGNACSSSDSQFLLWRSIEIGISSLKISLCRPDVLLLSGIACNSLISAMEVSSRLAQGNLVATRRSALLVSTHVGGDEGMLALLDELSRAILTISGKEQEKAIHEAPWTTISSYGILLCVWGALRRASADIKHHLDTFNELPRISAFSMLIFNTLMEVALSDFSSMQDGPMRDSRLWSTDRLAFVNLVEDGEPCFVDLIKGFCGRRYVWGVGPSMLAVLRDITDSG